MTKILMVCLGNICRSPLAEAILSDKLKKNGLNDIKVDSAGTSAYHIGEQPDLRTAENARKHGLEISHLVGRQFTVKDFDRFDKIYVMDNSNYNNVIELASNEKEVDKVEMILNILHPGLNMPVPDPYFGGETGFENVYNLLDEACERIILNIQKNSL
ncbi:MAG: low molecular weight phosphotyrosine protein phosphatase [Bacteroidota bacterium]|nr:low molecular weight phosphotyrosine protein phosphatase [Bacteroidota bacterium]